MATATDLVYRVKYPTGQIIDHPSSTRESELMKHIARKDAKLLGRFEITFEYPEEGEIVYETLQALGFEPTPWLIKLYCDNLDSPAQLRQILLEIKEAS